MSTLDDGNLKKVNNSNNESTSYDDSELSSTLERAFMKQLHDVVCKLEYKKLNMSNEYDNEDNLCVTVKSTEEDLQNWLIAKGFSRKIIKMFEKCNGRNAFLLDKEVFKKYCGKEGDRLYSLLLIEKNKSGYKTYTSRELELLLQHRKTKTEKDNDGDRSEPIQRPPSVLQGIDFSEDEETYYRDVEHFINGTTIKQDKCYHVRQISLDSLSNNSCDFEKIEGETKKYGEDVLKDLYDKYEAPTSVSQNKTKYVK
uniref:SAM_3 domain-containing protein n=2 Tax=Strongyloides papillosus TaxID=174720 RepID=A0A0N5CC27_STREA